MYPQNGNNTRTYFIEVFGGLDEVVIGKGTYNSAQYTKDPM
jgi:hypothetical protein